MRNIDYTASADFLKRLFGQTLQKVELRACPNDRSGAASSRFTRDAADIEAFCAAKDIDGSGVYFGVCTRQEGATSGNQQTVVECPALWTDIDCSKQDIAVKDAVKALNFLPHPPTIIVNSGAGLHAYWVLEEAADITFGQPVRERITAALKRLAMVLAGDMACAEVARILRLPGTHNTKPATRALHSGEAALCTVISDSQAIYDLDELCEWLGEQRVILHGKAAEARPVIENDPFVAYARQAGYEPAIDIDAALAAMTHGASGGTSIHETQLKVSMSMIARGYDDDEIVTRVLAATEAAAPSDQRWNWGREEAAIRKMVATGRSKATARDTAPRSQPMAAGSAALKLVHDADKEPKPVKTPKESKSTTVIVGKAAIAVWQDRHGPVMHTDGTTYAYDAGIWIDWDDRMAQRLRAIIQEACASLKIEPKTSLLNAAKAYFMDRPELVQGEVAFDAHGLIIAEDGTIDPKTGLVGEHSPTHFALFKVGASVQGSRGCPTWLNFIAQTFADKPKDEAAAIILTVQEWFGAMLVPHKPRSMKLGMLAHGDSRTGKTQIAQVARGLLGVRHVSGARMRDLEGRFGMEPFLNKRGWIADDAIGEGEYLDADTYKVVVTGEETSVQCKGGRNVETHFGFPVMLTANNLPRVKDQSDAVYNRSLILPCTNVRSKTAAEPAGYNSIAEKIIAEDLTGVLWWAFEGWQRLSQRGFYDPPRTMTEAAKSFEAGNNPVGTWKEECLEEALGFKVSRADLLGSMNGWWAQEYGVDAKPWSGRGFFPQLTKSIPGYTKDRETTDHEGTRFLTGIKLNTAGLVSWRVHKDSRWGEASKTSSEETFVNRDHALAPAPTASIDRKPRF